MHDVNNAGQLLDGARSEPGDEAIDEEIVENRDRDTGDKTAGHKGAPEVHVPVDQESGDAHAHGEVSYGGNKDILVMS